MKKPYRAKPVNLIMKTKAFSAVSCLLIKYK